MRQRLFLVELKYHVKLVSENKLQISCCVRFLLPMQTRRRRESRTAQVSVSAECLSSSLTLISSFSFVVRGARLLISILFLSFIRDLTRGFIGSTLDEETNTDTADFLSSVSYQDIYRLLSDSLSSNQAKLFLKSCNKINDTLCIKN